MISVLLTILKIIGIMILVLLGIVVFLLALVLLHPLQYEAMGEIEEKRYELNCKVSWLFRLIQYGIRVNKDGQVTYLKILGFQVRRRKEDAEKEDAKTQAEYTASREPPDMEPEELEPKKTQVPEEEQIEAEDSMETGDSMKDAPEEKDTSGTQEPGKERKKFSGEKWKSLHRQKEKIKKECSDIRNRQALLHVWKEMIYLLKHTKPRNKKADILYGTQDPALTGLLTGMLSMVPWVYEKGVQVLPDFTSDRLYIIGTFFIKGHLRMIHVLCIACRLFLDKDITRIRKKLGY